MNAIISWHNQSIQPKNGSLIVQMRPSSRDIPDIAGQIPDTIRITDRTGGQ
jgi:hypothetical protein